VKLSDEDVMDRPHTLARAILLGDGRAFFPYICNIAKATEGAIKSVTRDELTQAYEMLRDLEEVGVCYASAGTVAAVRNECREQRIGPGQMVLLNLTGRGLPQGQL
jgi:threonine synthase